MYLNHDVQISNTSVPGVDEETGWQWSENAARLNAVSGYNDLVGVDTWQHTHLEGTEIKRENYFPLSTKRFWLNGEFFHKVMLWNHTFRCFWNQLTLLKTFTSEVHGCWRTEHQPSQHPRPQSCTRRRKRCHLLVWSEQVSWIPAGQ